MGQKSLDPIYLDQTFCDRDSSTPLPHQIQAAKKITDSLRGLLIYHEIGTGKTLTTLLALQEHRNSKIVLIMPKILQGNFRIEAKKHGFSLEFQGFDPENDKEKDPSYFSNSMIVIDEVHQFAFKLVHGIKPYPDLYKALQEASGVKFILLSGTPIYETPFELSPIYNLLAGREIFPRSGKQFKDFYFNDVSLEPFRTGELRYLIKPLTSYFGMENSPLFPKLKGVSMLSYSIPKEHQEMVQNPEDELLIFPFNPLYNTSLKTIFQDIQKRLSEPGNFFIYCQYGHLIPIIQQFLIQKGIPEITSLDQIRDTSTSSFLYITSDNYEDFQASLGKIRIIIGSHESTVGISIPDVRTAYLLSVPDFFGDIQQISGRVRRICIDRTLPEKYRTIQYYILMPSGGQDLIRKKLKSIGIYYKLNSAFLELLKEVGL